LSEQLLPELYQRLAQYELHLPALRDRDASEKVQLFETFVDKYQAAVRKVHGLDFRVVFSPEARDLLLSAQYPRNIRQFRDVINSSIDAASPLIEDIQSKQTITTRVETCHLPFEMATPSAKSPPAATPPAETPLPSAKSGTPNRADPPKSKGLQPAVKARILELKTQGLGPRRIAKVLKDQGVAIEYYQVAYFFKKVNRSQ
jgi:arginine utilization regulatory protein